MSESPATRRLAVEMHSADDRPSWAQIGSRSIHQFWPLLALHFREVLLPPQRRPDTEVVSWTWREGAGETALTAADLAEVRRRLEQGAQSLGAREAGNGREPTREDDDDHRDGSTQVVTAVQAMIAALTTATDPELSGFVCRTDSGLRVHSWGAATPGRPYCPDALDREVSGTVIMGGENAAGLTLVLENRQGAAIARALTDATGAFRFSKIGPGNYRLRMTGRGDFPATGFGVTVEHGSVTGLELRRGATVATSTGWASAGGPLEIAAPLQDEAGPAAMAPDECGRGAAPRRRRGPAFALIAAGGLATGLLMWLRGSGPPGEREILMSASTWWQAVGGPFAGMPAKRAGGSASSTSRENGPEPGAAARIAAPAAAASGPTADWATGAAARAATAAGGVEPGSFRGGVAGPAPDPVAGAAPGTGGASPAVIHGDRPRANDSQPTASRARAKPATTSSSPSPLEQPAPDVTPTGEPVPAIVTTTPAAPANSPAAAGGTAGTARQPLDEAQEVEAPVAAAPSSLPPSAFRGVEPEWMAGSWHVAPARWIPRLRRDAILPTVPVPEGADDGMAEARRAAHIEQDARLPAAFRNPRTTAGFVFELSEKISPPGGALEWRGPSGAGAVGTVIDGLRAEAGWLGDGVVADLAVELLAPDGRKIARVRTGDGGGALVDAVEGVRVWFWIGVDAPSSGHAGGARPGSAARLEWQHPSGAPVPDAWPRREVWPGGRGYRLEIPLERGRTAGPAQDLLLADTSTGWALAREALQRIPRI